jgi:hypothetical protein
MVIINEDDSVDIKCGDITIHIEHNDLGVNLNYFTKKKKEPVRSEWVPFEELLKEETHE